VPIGLWVGRRRVSEEQKPCELNERMVLAEFSVACKLPTVEFLVLAWMSRENLP
jgi:hypothetical protein